MHLASTPASELPVWTRAKVCEALITAFRRPAGLYLATPREVEQMLQWRLRFPQIDTAGWRFLLAWAECQAGRTSIEERRRLRGWTSWEFQTGWRRTADLVADLLNRERVNTAQLLAGADAEERLEAEGRLAPPSPGPEPRRRLDG